MTALHSATNEERAKQYGLANKARGKSDVVDFGKDK